MNTIQHLVRSVNYWKIPKRCVAFGCGNTAKDGVSLFSFPKDPVLSKKWTEQGKRTRDEWLGPTKYSFLCSCHFTEDCFQPDVVVAASLGLSKRMKLKSDAIPTVFKRPVSEYQTKEASHLKKSKSTSRHERYKRRK